MDAVAHARRPAHARRRATVPLPAATVAGLVLLAVGLLCATAPFALMAVNTFGESSQVAAHAQAVAGVPDVDAGREWQQAQDYNRRLFEEGSDVLGDVTDPWSDGERSIADRDRAYQDALDLPSDGIMASVRYPSLGIDLPIRHGTTAKVLAAGAGHLYGTSLPVGGTNTHAVISAHTGYDRLMFDRLSLGQGHVGDRFTIEVLGHTLAYRVTDIRVIDPDDFSVFGIEAGKDEVSLLTCTPYGVNTRRLVVTGERVDIPDPAPAPDDVPLARPGWWLLAAVGVVWLAFAVFVVLTIRARRRGNDGEQAA